MRRRILSLAALLLLAGMALGATAIPSQAQMQDWPSGSNCQLVDEEGVSLARPASTSAASFLGLGTWRWNLLRWGILRRASLSGSLVGLAVLPRKGW